LLDYLQSPGVSSLGSWKVLEFLKFKEWELWIHEPTNIVTQHTELKPGSVALHYIQPENGIRVFSQACMELMSHYKLL